MNLSIYEKHNYFSMDMNYYEGKELDNKEALNKRFTLVIIEKGSGIVKINNKNMFFIAPVLFCINEKENIIINKSLNLNIKVMYFHPNVINFELNFNNVRHIPSSFSMSQIQDAHTVKYFLERNEKYNGKLNINTITLKRFKYLFKAIKGQVSTQKAMNWPCRSRSFLFEMLFLIDNIQTEDNMASEFISDIEDDEVQKILLYLYNNYNKKITITDLTQKFNINRTTLSEKFSVNVGESIVSFLNRLRINIASIILRDSLLPVGEVMSRVGFTDSIHFFRTFKKYMGLSPTEYREKYCWMDE